MIRLLSDFAEKNRADTLRRYLCLIIIAGLATTSPALYALDKVRLQLRFDHQFQFAGYYAAQWQGFYAEAGLDVEILPGIRLDGSMVAVPDVLKHGAAEFGIGSGDILLAIDRGTPLTVVASIFQQSPVELFARNETQLSSPADLTRLQVLEDPNPLVRAEINAMLHAEGIPAESVRFMAFDRKASVLDRIQSLMTGEVDVLPGYALSIPWYAQEQGVQLTSLKPAAYGVDFYGDSLFTTTGLAKNNPDLVKRFRDASIKGWEYALANTDETVERIVTELPRQLPVTDLLAYNKFLAKKIRSLMNYHIIEIGHSNPKRWQRMQDALLAAGAIRRPMAELDLVFDPERLEHERKRLWLTLALVAAVAAVIIISALSFISLLRAKRRTEENERRYRALFDNSPISIWEEDCSAVKIYLDKEMATTTQSIREFLMDRPDVVAECAKRVRILDVNRATLSLYKASSKADVLKYIPANFTDESFSAFREELISLAEGNSDFETEATVKNSLGEPLQVDLRLSILPTARAHWERVVVLLTDITERKQSEAQLNRYRIMVSATDDLMAYVSTDYRYLMVNDGYCKAFLKNKEAIIGKHVSELMGEEIFNNIKPELDQCLAGDNICYDITMDFPLMGERHLHVNYYPVKNSSGEIDGLIVHLHDLTTIIQLKNELIAHRDNLERQVENRTEKLTLALQEIEAFTYAVSHDLCAPLRSISGFSSALQENCSGQLDSKGRDYLNRILKNTKKMGEQIDGLLSLSHLNRGEMHYSTMDASSLAQELAEKYSRLYPGMNAEVIIEPDVELFGDKRLLTIALDNIVGNAFKFSSKADAPRIEFGQTIANDRRAIFIRDNGIGFDTQHSDSLFVVFQRLQTDLTEPA